MLTFYVEFTMIPTPTWSVLSSYYNLTGNTVYATVAAPTAPMASPWVGVLNYACKWASRKADATSATTALCNGFYSSTKYDPSQQWYTSQSTSPETFHLLNFLNKTMGASTASSGLQGQCNDFSDFLSCLSNSIGGVVIQTQRSNSGFPYSNVTFAPDNSIPSQIGNFVYHQWTTDGTTTSGNIFDSAVRPVQTMTIPPVNEPLSQYLSWLAPTTSLAGLSPVNPKIAN